MRINKTKLQDNEAQDALDNLLKFLPALPSMVRYFDDFDNQVRTIKDFITTRKIELYINGGKINIYFEKYENGVDFLAKQLFFYMISENLSISTAYGRLQGLYFLSRNKLNLLINSNPDNFIKIWQSFLADQNLNKGNLEAVKTLMFYFAKYNLANWSPSYSDFLSQLPLPVVDKYASIKKGDVFLSTLEERKIVEYLDNFVLYLKNTNVDVDFNSIRNAGIVLCSYQFGMRPIQIALITMRDIRIWDKLNDGVIIVHLKFKTVKQRSKSSSHILLRKVKPEWSPIFTELYKLNLIDKLSGEERIFRVRSADEVRLIVSKVVSKIIGRDSSATDLRHTGAQRMVDGGASQEELAEFMGHTDITTGLVYFQTSANQAERVNQALGISPIYQQVVKIAHDKFISKEELGELKGTHQIAGVPHGIPITGIGACSSGQPACPFNPVTSCYGCRKFMPLQEVNVHERVLEGMREVVGFFNTESKGDLASPTYLQLQNTISGVQQIIAEIKGRSHA